MRLLSGLLASFSFYCSVMGFREGGTFAAIGFVGIPFGLVFGWYATRSPKRADQDGPPKRLIEMKILDPWLTVGMIAIMIAGILAGLLITRR